MKLYGLSSVRQQMHERRYVGLPMDAPISLVTWNIFQGLHYSSKGRRWVQNAAIEDHLASLDADVLVLPETWLFRRPNTTWAEDLAASLGYELHQWVADRPSRPREVVRWRMVIMTRIPARRLDDVVFPQFGRLAARAMVRVELVDAGLTVGGVHLYGIHLLPENPRAWFRERAAFRNAVQGLDIVAGDMNIWGPVVRRDTPDMRSAVKGRTFPAHRPHSQIDHIMVSDRVEVINGERLPDMGSDHRGLRVTIRRG